ncbi:uncharacterized protein LOC117143798 [Drosophila mauritiana]|uniref:Uncharacterized protein LOC117143798 n=1 Tax=Drosophila mauritiana TaxID=7226 RepID=A0A6P8K823_DROMA|nr:uncharacterized protein LOC117143798 [Drosophila mauritiana]
MKDCIEIFDGEFEVLRVTPPLYDEVEELLVNISINYEFGCVIAKLKDSPLAIAELRNLIRHIISRGISFAIRHVESGRIVAAIANIIFNTKRKTLYYDICDQIRSPNMIKYMELWDAIDASFDVNEHCQVDSTGDVEYMATVPEFRRRGLGHILCQHSIQFASLLAQRKLPLETLAQLPEEMRIERPQAVVAITTSQSSQIMGRQLGMKTVHKWHFSELMSLCGAMAESNGAAQACEYAELQVVKI